MNMRINVPWFILDKLYYLMDMYVFFLEKLGLTRIMHNCPNRGVTYHIFENKGNYLVITIYSDMDKLNVQ